MLVPCALRAFARASAALRQAAVAGAASWESTLRDNVTQLANGAAAPVPALPLPFALQRRHLTVSRSDAAALVRGADAAAPPPALRDADDEALSPHPPTTGSSPLTVRYPFAIEYYKDTEAVVYSLDQEPQGLVRLPGAAFNVPVRLDILHRVVRYWRAKWQQGTHKAKRRGEVRGGGRKPWPQKKTGRARQGSIRSPLWKGGGVSHAPLPRSHAHKLTRSTMRLGMRCALSAKINEGRFYVVEDFLRIRGWESSALAAAFGPARADASGTAAGGSAAAAPVPEERVRDYGDLKQRLTRLTSGSYGATWLLVDSGEAGRDGGMRLRKMTKGKVVVEVMSPEQLTVYHVLKYHRLVVSRAALRTLAESLLQPHRVRKPVKHAWWAKRQDDLQAAVRELTQAAAAV